MKILDGFLHHVRPFLNTRERNIDDDRYEIILSTTVSDEDENIYVNVKGKAIFYTQPKNMDILEKNTIAIMVPYIRSYISIITIQPGMAPILLSAMKTMLQHYLLNPPVEQEFYAQLGVCCDHGTQLAVRYAGQPS